LTSERRELEGQVGLVVGGNAGIGLAMARALAAAGASVAIWGRHRERNEEAVESLRGLGGQATAVECDVGEESEIEAAFEQTVRRLGRVDCCVSCAAHAAPFTKFTEQTLDQWRATIRVNLEGTFLTMRAASRHLIGRGEGGSLIAISSLAGVHGMPSGEPYAATKAAIPGLMRSLAVELAPHGIRANTVVPGFIETRMTSYFAKPAFEAAVLPRVPAGRWGKPEDLGGIAVYLASPASAYHTGDTFVIDGGYSRF
jgi:NAD(P)-dependent dehydrogenase (short-subunit alcohol dehydrogenase family)